MKSVFKFIFAFCFVLSGTLGAFAALEKHEEFARQYMPESQAIFEEFRKECHKTKLMRENLEKNLRMMNRDLDKDAAYYALVYKIEVLEKKEETWSKFLIDCYFKHKGGLLTKEELESKDLAMVKKARVWKLGRLKSFLEVEVGNFVAPKLKLVKIPNENWFIGKYEVTQKEYLEVMGKNPSYFKGDENRPVEEVSWHDAMEFCKRLTECERNARAVGYKYTLPTSEQWELACRAGTTTKFCSGDTEDDLSRVAWWNENSSWKTHPVGTKEPNAWGIHDMHGNVWEWCLDEHPRYRSCRVSRGGGYGSSVADRCESSSVDYDNPDYRNYLGFRVVLVPVGQ